MVIIGMDNINNFLEKEEKSLKVDDITSGETLDIFSGQEQVVQLLTPVSELYGVTVHTLGKEHLSCIGEHCKLCKDYGTPSKRYVGVFMSPQRGKKIFLYNSGIKKILEKYASNLTGTVKNRLSLYRSFGSPFVSVKILETIGSTFEKSKEEDIRLAFDYKRKLENSYRELTASEKEGIEFKHSDISKEISSMKKLELPTL